MVDETLIERVDEDVADREGAKTRAISSMHQLADEIQALKGSVIALNEDIRTLEEDMLFPANTQLSVFVSLDVGEFFTLEAVKVKIDGRLMTSHIYQDSERNALAASGIHKIYLGSVSAGQHELTAFYSGKGPNGRVYKRASTERFEKQNGPKFVELKIVDSGIKQQPEFRIQQW